MTRALASFYREHAPDKVSHLPGIAKKYAGKMPELYARLHRRYGTAPTELLVSSTVVAADDAAHPETHATEALTAPRLDVPRKKKKAGFHREYYATLVDVPLGTQQCAQVELLSMMEQDDEGYYRAVVREPL
jgi:hypothetical protein